MENQMDSFIKNTSYVKSSRVKGIIAGFLLIFFQIEILLWFNNLNYLENKQRCSCKPLTTVKVIMNLLLGPGFTPSTMTQSWNLIVFSDLNHFFEVQFLLHLPLLFSGGVLWHLGHCFSYFNVHINFLKILLKRRFWLH